MNKLKEKLTELFGFDLRSLALFRIGLAIVIIMDLSIRVHDSKALYSDFGLLPRSTLIDSITNSWYWSINLINGQPAFQALIFILGILTAISLLVGYRTRLATIALWAMITSIHNRNPAVTFAADEVLRALLFWSMFLPLGATYSLDSSLNSSEKPLPKAILSGATLALTVQQCFIYMISVAFKATSTIWWPDGDAVYYALNFEQYAKPFAGFLLNFPWFLKFSTYATLAVELFGPLFIFIPFKNTIFRTVTVICFVILHLTFDLGFEIGIFPLLSTSSWLAFMPSPIWDYFENKIKNPQRNGLKIYYDADCGFCKKVVYILRTFLILPGTPLLKAQENESIYADMLEKNSWVVEDWQGNRHFKWEALAYVVSLSPVFKPLALLMTWPPLMSGGTKFYETIANNRKIAGKLTAPLKFRPLEVYSALFTNIIILILLFLTTLWNFRSFVQQRYYFRTEKKDDWISFAYHLYNRRTINSLDWISRVTRLDQNWSIFAPAPPRDDGWYVIQGTLKDGTEVDLLTQKPGAVTFEKPTIKQRYELYRNMQWRTYFINLNRAIGNKLYPDYADYLCRVWNSENSDQQQLNNFTIYFMDEETPPPGSQPTVEKKIRFEKDCN